MPTGPEWMPNGLGRVTLPSGAFLSEIPMAALSVPWDQRQGLGAGKRSGSLEIMKSKGASSAHLWGMMTAKTNLRCIAVPLSPGRVAVLEDVTIRRIRSHVNPEAEVIELIYQRIEITWVGGGSKTGNDDWGFRR